MEREREEEGGRREGEEPALPMKKSFPHSWLNLTFFLDLFLIRRLFQVLQTNSHPGLTADC